MRKSPASRANTLIGWKWLFFGRRKTFAQHSLQKLCFQLILNIWLGKAFGSTLYSRYQLEEKPNFHHVISGNESVHAFAKDLSLDIDKFGNMVVVSYHPKSSEYTEQMSGGFYLL